MYRDDCKHFACIDTEHEGDIYFCKRATNKMCYQGPITTCEHYEVKKKRRKWLPQFIKEEEFSV